MPREIEFEGKVHEFPDDATDDEIRRVLSGKVIYGPKQTPAAAPPQAAAPSLGRQFLEADKALTEGFKKGVSSTVYHGGDLLRRMFGSERIIDRPDVRQEITPQGGLEQIGYGGEKILEFMAPGGLVSRGAKTIAQIAGSGRFAPALNVLGRASLEAGTAASVAGLQTGGDVEAMGQAAATAGGVTAGLGAAGEGLRRVAPVLKESALAQYKRVLNPTKEGTKILAQRQVAPGLIERGVMAGTLKGLQSKGAALVEKWGQAIDDYWSQIPPGASVDLNAVTKHLDATVDDFVITTSRGDVPMGDLAEQALMNTGKMKQLLTNIAEPNPVTGAMEIPAKNLRKLRGFFDKQAAKAGRYQGKTLSEGSTIEAQGVAADAIREELGQQFPDLGKMNKEFNFWKNAQEVIDQTVQRRTGQAKPLGRKLAGAAGTGAGFVTGGIPGAIVGKKAMDMLEQLTTSTAWGTVSAVFKDRLAKALASGNSAAAELWLRKISASIGGAAATYGPSQRPAQRPAEAR